MAIVDALCEFCTTFSPDMTANLSPTLTSVAEGKDTHVMARYAQRALRRHDRYAY